MYFTAVYCLVGLAICNTYPSTLGVVLGSYFRHWASTQFMGFPDEVYTAMYFLLYIYLKATTTSTI